MKERIEDDIRWYTDDDGLDYISVTSVLGVYSDKSTLKKWYDRVGHEEAAKICADSSKLGLDAHLEIELFLETGQLPTIPHAKVAVRDFYKHVTAYKQEEVVVFNDGTCRYAGRYDQLVSVEKDTFIETGTGKSIEAGYYLCDLKTKRKLPSIDAFYLYKKYFLQASAYYNVLKDDYDIKGAIISCAGARKSRLVYISRKDLESYFDYYYSLLLNLYTGKELDIPYTSFTELYYDNRVLFSRGPVELLAA